MTKIILIRHGETEWNVEEVFRGRIDVELNETGIREASLLAQYLSDSEITAIYSSPLKRALQTAEIIAGYHKIKVEIAPELVDFDFGEWQGLSCRTVADKYKQLYAQWLENPLVKIPGAETLDDVRSRAMRLVNSLVTKYEGATVALVSHRVVNKVLICALLSLDNSYFWNIRIDTAGISIFTYENGRVVLIKHNDTSFLEPIRKVPLNDF